MHKYICTYSLSVCMCTCTFKIKYDVFKYMWQHFGVEMDVQSREKCVRFMQLKGEREGKFQEPNCTNKCKDVKL